VRILYRHLAGLLLAASAVVAHADTVFDLSGQSTFGPASGTMTVNTTTGQVTQVALLLGGSDFGILYGYFSVPDPEDPTTTIEATNVDDFELTFVLTLPVASLIDYKGGPVCSSSNGIDYCSPIFEQIGEIGGLTSGSFEPESPTSITPEPSALTLFGTGVLGLLGIARRKLW
jgi:hypothetical protein